jgi:YjbE family integral membrane protein
MVIDTALLLIFLKVILIDLAMAGDDVLILAAISLKFPQHQRKAALRIGVAVSLLVIFGFSSLIISLLQIPGLKLLGGGLLFYVAYQFLQHMRGVHSPKPVREIADSPFYKTVITIVLADLSMSSENVLAVASVAHDHAYIMYMGLVASAILMTIATEKASHLVVRHKWLSVIGFLMIVWAAAEMVYSDRAFVSTAARALGVPL